MLLIDFSAEHIEFSRCNAHLFDMGRAAARIGLCHQTLPILQVAYDHLTELIAALNSILRGNRELLRKAKREALLNQLVRDVQFLCLLLDHLNGIVVVISHHDGAFHSLIARFATEFIAFFLGPCRLSVRRVKRQQLLLPLGLVVRVQLHTLELVLALVRPIGATSGILGVDRSFKFIGTTSFGGFEDRRWFLAKAYPRRCLGLI